MRRASGLLMLSWASLSETRRQSAYLALTLAVAVASWLVLSAMASPFVDRNVQPGAGVTIRNASQNQRPLPLRYARRIEALPGVRAAAWLTLQLVTCRPATTVTINAIGGGGADSLLAPEHIDKAVIERWNRDPLGVLISDKDAADCGWHPGQGVEPPDVMGRKNLPLHIAGIFHSTKGGAAYAHFDYINRMDPLFSKDTVLYYFAFGGGGRKDELLAAHIEQEFAQDFPTVSAATNTTSQNAWARFGKVQQLLAFVMIAILLCTASVLISVLAHAAAQRRAKFALLQALGFTRGRLLGLFVAEFFAIAMIGVLLGIGTGNAAAHLFAPTKLGVISSGMSIPDWAYQWMPAWLALLIITGLAWPSVTIWHVRPADYRAI